MTEAYPLQWPAGQPRTPSYQRQSARFDTTQNAAQEHIIAEIKRLGGRDPIISTMIQLRRDGLPYAGQREPDDRGVAVYFSYKGKQMCFACDKWDKIKDNMQAIAKTIEALRGIARWGSGDMMERAFTGFTALPNPERHWSEILGVPSNASLDDIEAAYRRKAREAHPDTGGSDQAMARLNGARDRARQERG